MLLHVCKKYIYIVMYRYLDMYVGMYVCNLRVCVVQKINRSPTTSMKIIQLVFSGIYSPWAGIQLPELGRGKLESVDLVDLSSFSWNISFKNIATLYPRSEP